MEKNKKILLGGIIVIVAAIVFSVLLLNRNQISVTSLTEIPKVTKPLSGGSTPPPSAEQLDLSPEAIANWSVCRNEKYGYEFKYPKGWYLSGSYDESYTHAPEATGVILCERGMFISVSPIQQSMRSTSYNDPSPSFFISVQNQTDLVRASSSFAGVKSVYEYHERVLKTSQRIPLIIKEGIIGGEKALWWSDEIEDKTSIGAIFMHKEIIFTSYSKILGYEFNDAILSTFKFLD